ncbi:MAG TPA: CPBP family intramembrane glutamic endopeptidase, partial [Acidimicrobiales bacterium]|nr:CPBP family intramembrane glutamic endopeptidase [Acidimicrobiales bacterium]
GTAQLPARAAWWASLGASVAVLLAGVGESIGYAITGSETSALTELLGEMGLWAAMIATALLVSRRYGSSSLSRDYGLAFARADLLWGFLATLAALAISQAVVLPFSGTRFAGSNDQILTQQQGHEAGFVIVALIVALGAPFFEELFFRGYLRTCLQSRFGPHGAIWLQAGFFGLAHLGEVSGWANVSVVLALFFVGAVLGYTAWLTRRLGAGMVAHCLFNLLAVVTLL